ncbi:MAG TPA: hypothetical protein VMU85_22725, partial [Stellaceae bacterium]|nr:hypothetical protein [Stellaceae bacterium]
RRRRRRRRRGGDEGREAPGAGGEPAEQAFDEAHALSAEEIATGEAVLETQSGEVESGPEHTNGDGGQRKRRRRGRRGGKRRRRGGPGEAHANAGDALEGEAEPGENGEQDYEPAPEPWTTVREGESWATGGSERQESAQEPDRHEPEPEPSHAVQSAAEATASEPTPTSPESATTTPPITITERPANPKRGWWHRLTQS